MINKWLGKKWLKHFFESMPDKIRQNCQWSSYRQSCRKVWVIATAIFKRVIKFLRHCGWCINWSYNFTSVLNVRAASWVLNLVATSWVSYAALQHSVATDSRCLVCIDDYNYKQTLKWRCVPHRSSSVQQWKQKLSHEKFYI